MSDPVKNAEVEDVLSSIRRLVSEDKRPLQTQKSEAVAPSADRLVLTPALRVAQETDVSEEGAAEEVVAVRAEAQAAPDETLAVEDAALNAQAQQEAGTLDAMLAETADADAAKSDNSLPSDAQVLSENYDDDPYNFADGEDQDGDAGDALLLTNPTIATPETEAEPMPDAQGEAAEDAAEADETAQKESVSEPQLTAEDAASRKAETLSAKIAALETAIGGISDEWEPDTAGQDAYAGSKPIEMEWEDDEPPEAEAAGEEPSYHPESDEAVDITPPSEETAAPAQEAVAQEDPLDDVLDGGDDDDESTGFAMGAEDQLLDEDTLREMINEIVHSELQGALGARITRNVRRLVRREIHRALTARDLE